LKGLAECYTQLDKKRRALETLERLVAFDPRNYANHFELARALERFEEPDAAREAYRETLRIHPTHLPAVEALIGLHADGGRQAEVVATYEAYLDAYLLARLELTLGAARATVEVPADGRVHRVEVALPLVGPEAGWPCLATHGYSLEPLSLRLEAPQRVGTVGSAEPTLWTSGSSGLETSGFELRLTVLAAVEPDSTACLVLELPETGVTRAVLELRVFKMLPAELWNAVQAAYRNTLAGEALERARERSAVGGLLSAGSVWGG
jgi:tetratricopeptide (TPR) repeat protein